MCCWKISGVAQIGSCCSPPGRLLYRPALLCLQGRCVGWLPCVLRYCCVCGIAVLRHRIVHCPALPRTFPPSPRRKRLRILTPLSPYNAEPVLAPKSEITFATGILGPNRRSEAGVVRLADAHYGLYHIANTSVAVGLDTEDQSFMRRSVYRPYATLVLVLTDCVPALPQRGREGDPYRYHPDITNSPNSQYPLTKSTGSP
jgi:hypothetical protein